MESFCQLFSENQNGDFKLKPENCISSLFGILYVGCWTLLGTRSAMKSDLTRVTPVTLLKPLSVMIRLE